ncbi:MAG: hypothetical protein ACI4UE_05475 [Candidatus Scatovivens sp.]
MRNFNKAYERVIKKYNEYLKKIKVTSYIYTFLVGIFVLSTSYFMLIDFIYDKKNLIILCITFFICFIFWNIYIKEKNTIVLKYGVINELVKEYDLGLKYNPKGTIIKEVYMLGEFDDRI